MALQKQQKLSDILKSQNYGYLQRVDDELFEVYLQGGKINSKEPCFLRDENNEEYVILPQRVLKSIIALVRKAHEDHLRVELERDVISLTPIDFDDVMSVAMNRLESLRNKDGSLPQINTMQFLKEIKKEHPNLFLNFDAIIGRQK